MSAITHGLLVSACPSPWSIEKTGHFRTAGSQQGFMSVLNFDAVTTILCSC